MTNPAWRRLAPGRGVARSDRDSVPATQNTRRRKAARDGDGVPDEWTFQFVLDYAVQKSYLLPVPSGRPIEFDRAAALETAVDLFRSKGFEQLPIEELTEAMGIGRGSLYAAFGSKRDLYLEALNAFADRALAGLRSTLIDGPSPLGSLRAFLGMWPRMAESACGKGCFVTNALIEKAQHDPEVARITGRFLREEELLLRGLLADAQERGELPSKRDVAAIARTIATARLGVTIQSRLGTDAARIQSIVDGILLLLDPSDS